MMGKTHLGLGLLAGTLAPVAGLPSPDGLAAWTALALGSVAPDLDSGHGLITSPSDWLPDVIPVPAWVDSLARAAGKAIRIVFGHRGLLHYPLVAVALGAAAWLSGLDWLLWFAAGYGIHLVADALTVAGIPAFGPVSKRRVGPLPRAIRLKTDSLAEKAILAATWAGLAWLVLPEIWKEVILP